MHAGTNWITGQLAHGYIVKIEYVKAYTNKKKMDSYLVFNKFYHEQRVM